MLLKKLTEAVGISGRETEVREIIKEEVANHVEEVKTDSLGNLITYQQGDPAKPTLMLAAHMDEIGLMITQITSDGLLKFKPVGGIDKRILVSKQVVIGEEKIPGVIGAKAIHLQEPKERKKVLDYKKLYIDIGADDKDQAKQKIDLGMMASFPTRYQKLNNGLIKGKAFDDRLGCAELIKIIQEDYDFSLYGVFTVQEEIGTRGAKVATYSIDPDLALVLEGTTASDVPESKEAEYSTSLGEGPALTLRDASTIPDPRLVEELTTIAKEEEITYQWRQSTQAGTDAGAIHLTKEGIPTAVISVPCRYIHSPVSLADLKDYQATIHLVRSFCEKIDKGGIKLETIN